MTWGEFMRPLGFCFDFLALLLSPKSFFLVLAVSLSASHCSCWLSFKMVCFMLSHHPGKMCVLLFVTNTCTGTSIWNLLKERTFQELQKWNTHLFVQQCIVFPFLFSIWVSFGGWKARPTRVWSRSFLTGTRSNFLSTVAWCFCWPLLSASWSLWNIAH